MNPCVDGWREKPQMVGYLRTNLFVPQERTMGADAGIALPLMALSEVGYREGWYVDAEF